MIKNSAVPLYQQLFEDIKQKILEGKLQAGERMMTEAEISQQYDVSRITVRKAFELLNEEGYVVRKQGIGTFVAEKRLHSVVDHQILSFSEMSGVNGSAPSAEIVSVEWVLPEGTLMTHLRVDENERVLKIVRIRKNDGIPVMLEESYYPEKYAFLLQENLLGSTYQIFKNHGYIPTHGVKTFEICYATKEEGKILDVDEGQALMLQRDEVVDQNGDSLHYTKMLINTNRYRLTVIL